MSEPPPIPEPPWQTVPPEAQAARQELLEFLRALVVGLFFALGLRAAR
jgi:hypothetical protein